MKATALAALLALACSPAAAQESVCGERGGLLDHLRNAYKEQPAHVGLQGDGAVLEITASPEGTWTALVTYPNGVTCVIAAGESWETLPPVATGPEL